MGRSGAVRIARIGGKSDGTLDGLRRKNGRGLRFRERCIEDVEFGGSWTRRRQGIFKCAPIVCFLLTCLREMEILLRKGFGGLKRGVGHIEIGAIFYPRGELERRADGAINGAENEIGVGKTDFRFGRMNVDVNLIERNGKKKDDAGLLAVKKFLIGL